ncbi:MAG: trigger factor, partial [Gammaproteobacteria bacterium]|nr:trigger factor [Gammaproteobacteria bacterium]
MSFTATFEIYPEIEELVFDTIKIEKPVAEVSDEDLEAMIQNLREQRKQWSEVNRKAATGDQVMVDFEGRIDGQIFEGGAGKDMSVEIGAGAMLAEFEAGLKGIKAGEEKHVEVNFPDDYHGKEVAGKKAEFTLRATRVSEAILPEVDASLARSYGIEDGDLDKFRVDVRDKMVNELTQKIKLQVKNAVMAGLLEENDIIAPSALVAEEVKSLKLEAAKRMGKDIESIDSSALPDDMFQQEADKRVRLGLLVGEVIKSENIELDQDLVDSTLAEMAAAYEQPDQLKEYYRQNKDARTSLESMVLEDQVVNHILSKAKVTEKQSSFEEMTNNSN